MIAKDEILSSSTRKILALEGLRGVLALLVCTGHIGLNVVMARFGFTIQFQLAVDVFFVLSGYVLATHYYFGKRNFGRLIASRIARLYPLHLLTLVTISIIFIALGRNIDIQYLYQSVFLVQNIGLPPNTMGLNFPSWSISVEIVCALLFYVAARFPNLLSAILFGSVGLALTLGFNDRGLNAEGNVFGFLNLGLLRGVAGFSLGISVFLVRSLYSSGSAKFARTWPIWSAAIALLSLDQNWNMLDRGLFAASMFMLVLSASALSASSILSAKFAVWLGAISYSVYLLHMPIVYLFELLIGKEQSQGAMKVFILATIILASHFSYTRFEIPAQRATLGLYWSLRRRLGFEA